MHRGEGQRASCWAVNVTRCPPQCLCFEAQFSLAIPGGSVVAALGKLPKDVFDLSKVHVFFCNEKIPSYPCIDGALAQTQALGIAYPEVILDSVCYCKAGVAKCPGVMVPAAAHLAPRPCILRVWLCSAPANSQR